MNTTLITETIEQLDELINMLNDNEHYVTIDLAHQLREELAQIIDSE